MPYGHLHLDNTTGLSTSTFLKLPQSVFKLSEWRHHHPVIQARNRIILASFLFLNHMICCYHFLVTFEIHLLFPPFPTILT